MSIPTTPLKVPLQGKPLDASGNFTPPWVNFYQYLFNRVGAETAPSNTDLANAIALNVTGPSVAINNDVAVFDGTTGKLIKDSSVQIGSLAPLASPALTGIPTAPTAAPGTATGQIANTAFVANSIIGFGNVIGPASATADDIVLFNGVTGKVIKDSGVNLSSLATNAGVAATYAPLASPTFTGDPKAPTASPGDNDTSIATTAFVTAAIALPGSTKSSFSAHNNSVAQSIPTTVATTLSMSTATFNVGSNFSANTWTPPASRPVMMTGAVSMVMTGTGTLLVAIFKNGAEFKRGDQIQFSGLAAQRVAVTVSAVDIPNGTDVYTLSTTQTTGGSINTDGAPPLTYFQGTSIQA